MLRLRIAMATLLLSASAVAAGGQETVVLTADDPPAWGEAPIVVEEVRIGTLLGAAEYAFGMIGGVAVTSDGTIWVSDVQLGAVRRYTADGVYLDQIGRQGEGPGEFRYPGQIRVLGDGSVLVWDNGQIRVSRFDEGGGFMDAFAPETHMIGVDQQLEVERNENVYLIGANALEYFNRGTPLRLYWIRMRPDGQVLDTVNALPSEREGTVDPIRTFTAVSPLGYLVTARNDEYGLELHVSAERTVRIERPWEPVRYQRAERVEKQRREEAFSSRNGRPVRDIPREKPPFAGLYVDSQGRIWVRLHAPGYEEPETPGEQESRESACEFWAATEAECDANIESWREPVVYEVIRPDGQFLGRVELPNRQSELVHARDRLLWVVEQGELGEAYVVRYRIESGA